MNKVALDLDDVIAAFYPAMCKRHNMPEVKCNIWDGEVHNKWVADAMDHVHQDYDFWFHMPVLSFPRSITYDISAYITSSPEHLVQTRMLWLARNGFPLHPVYSTQDKVKTLKELDISILVDDKLSTVEQVNEAGLIGLQFKPYYMTEEIEDKSKVITHLSEVKNFL